MNHLRLKGGSPLFQTMFDALMAQVEGPLQGEWLQEYSCLLTVYNLTLVQGKEADGQNLELYGW